MNELFKKSFFDFVFDVVSRRWDEILLLIGLHGGLVFVMLELTSRMEPDGSGMNEGAAFLIMTVGVAFAVIVNMLVYGFLRSVAAVGCERLQPITLLKIGRRMFWRMIWIEILLGLLTIIFFTLFASIAASILQIAKDDTLGQLRIGAAGMFVSLICLMKFRLVACGMIFVFNCSVMEAFAGLRRFSLADGGKVLWAFAAAAAIVSGASYPMQAALEAGKDTLVYSAINGLVVGDSVVLWGLCSVYFVGHKLSPRSAQDQSDHSPTAES